MLLDSSKKSSKAVKKGAWGSVQARDWWQNALQKLLELTRQQQQQKAPKPNKNATNKQTNNNNKQ